MMLSALIEQRSLILLRRTTLLIRAVCGLAGRTSRTSVGLGLAFSIADEIDRAGLSLTVIAADERTDQRSASAKFLDGRPGNTGDPGCPRQVLPLDRPKRRRGGLSWSACSVQV